MVGYELALDVRGSDVDANGHMRNTAYSDFAAEARLAFLTDNGFGFARLRELGIGPIIFSEHLVYRRDVGLGDRVAVTLALWALTEDASRCSIEHRIRRARGDDAASVRLDGGWLSFASRRVVAPPAELAQVLRAAPRCASFAELS